MSTMTAQLLIGSAHPNDGGINPDYYLFLSENGVARWTLIKADFSPESKSSNPIIAQWIPTIDYMLEDAIVMIGLYVLKDEKIIHLANQYINKKTDPQIILFQDASVKGLELLRERARQIDHHYKITLSIFYGSTILNQYSVLKNYQMDAEVCLPVYAREYSVWSKSVMERGDLKEV